MLRVILHTRNHASKTSFRNKANKIANNLIKKHYKEFIKSKTISAHRKIILLTFYICPPLYALFLWAAELKAKQNKT